MTMQKFKALFKRGQRTERTHQGGHFDVHLQSPPTETAVGCSAPFSDSRCLAANSASITETEICSGSSRVNDSSTNMEDNTIKIRDEQIYLLLEENEKLRKILKSRLNLSDDECKSLIHEWKPTGKDCQPQDPKKPVITSTPNPSFASFPVPDISSVKSSDQNTKKPSSDDEIQKRLTQASARLTGLEDMNQLQTRKAAVFRSTPRPSVESLISSYPAPDISSIRLSDQNGKPTSHEELPILTSTDRGERMQRWLQELQVAGQSSTMISFCESTELESTLENETTEETASEFKSTGQSTMESGSTEQSSRVEATKSEDHSSLIVETSWLEDTLKEKLTNDTVVVVASSSSNDIADPGKVVGDTHEPKSLKEETVVISSSSSDDVIKDREKVVEETYEPKPLKDLALAKFTPKEDFISETVVVISSSSSDNIADPEKLVEETHEPKSLKELAWTCLEFKEEYGSAKIITPETKVTQLQDHLRQMEESQHSTNEELQATIQELSDLQTQLSQTKNEREKLREEKTLLLESLLRQTERLKSANNEITNLQNLLHDSGSNESSDRLDKLFTLLKQGQDQRKLMLEKQNELDHKINEVRRGKEFAEKENKTLVERVRELEVIVEDIQFEKRSIEEELSSLKDAEALKYFEILRLNVLLDIEETKVKELTAAQANLGNDDALYNMMSSALKEKESLEKKMAEKEDSLQRTNCENHRLNTEINTLREQLKVLKESAENAIYDLENHSKIRKMEQAKATKRIEELNHMVEDLNRQYDELSHTLQRVMGDLKLTEEKLQTTVAQLEEIKQENLRVKQSRDDESAEWRQLHQDLLVAVRVANELKTESLLQLERTQARVQELEQINAALQAENNKHLKKPASKVVDVVLRPPNVPKAPCASGATATQVPAVPKEPALKLPRPSLQCVNVKSLIESIENASKQTKSALPDACSGSKAGSPQREANPPLPFREQPLTSNKQTPQSAPPVISALTSPTDEKKDPLHSLVERNGGSKRNALLKWAQNRTQGYPNIEITNFSSSWTDGLALCALLHSYIPHKIPYNQLTPHNKQHNFCLAFSAAESVGIPTILNVSDMTLQERPDWQKVMAYVREIYTHFEGRDQI